MEVRSDILGREWARLTAKNSMKRLFLQTDGVGDGVMVVGVKVVEGRTG